MYIKSITLDGFKSYGNRVEVTGFDPAFNAITGLNGTGKSNILDSICFVLGITNLSNVRAGSLTELIYKHGQAGITKATVSITFDNRDKTQAPVGYESADEITITRQVRCSSPSTEVLVTCNTGSLNLLRAPVFTKQIVMGGKNKYLINGINVQNKRVSDLFCSVQLNVNNPHFLIMQGRITKVLNMKPPEILSMIEEAAGTSMYETKKLQALNTIAKKDAKLAELDDIIKEDIAPKLQKLQDERAQYQEHQQIIREIDGITKLYKAYQYDLTEKKCSELEQQMETAENDIKAREALIKENDKECKAIDKEIVVMHKKLDAESSGVLQELEERLSAAERQEAAAAAALRAADGSAAESDAKWRRDQRAHQDDQAALQAKRARADQAAETFSGLRAASESSAAALAAAQERFLAVSSGRGDGDGGDVQEQLAAARREAAEAGTRAAVATMDLEAHRARLQRLRTERAASGDKHKQDQAAVTERERRRADLQSELSALPYDAARHTALAAERRALQEAARAQRDALDALAARTHRCDFRYDPPHPNFDASSVHGTIARLIKVSDPMYYTAVETAAGGKLYNVVVDTEQTGKLLLQRGNLRTRATLIPLTKIRGTAIDANTVAAAQEIGGGTEAVQLALSLVSGAAALSPALRWVFGNTLVCRDLETAKRVCFHSRVRRRCVTLDGDVCDPAGTLSGGARSKEPSPLQQLAERAAAERALRHHEHQLQAVDAEHADLQRASEHYHAHKRRLDMVSHELEVLAARMAGSEHAHAQAEIEGLEAQVSEIRSALQRDNATQQEAAARAAQLETTAEDIKGHREREFKKAEVALHKAREAAEKHGAAWRERAGELETLRLEVAELEGSVEGAQRALEASCAARATAAAHRDRLHAAHQAATAEVHTVQDRIARHKAEVALRSRDVAVRAARKDALRAAARDADLRCKEVAVALTALRKEASALRSAVAALAAEEPWIAAEKQFFGLAGGAYDFVARGADGAAARLDRLAARRDALARGLNARAHTLHAKEEEQYAELLRKKRIVEADRRKLQETMRSLDEKKRSTLLAAAARVDRDFGAIFSSLLPGASARLEPPPGRAVLDGLEVRVAFNGAWKESLGELSGGQRSLVALALVLAMLRFKPAPLYILDEVDAALDLSHTQNIGLMLRDHFQTSQFIIVSLKDGMFNNANVLFRTRFQDGMSSVQRTVNAGGARPRARV